MREWCEQQAVAGFLEVDDPAADPDARVFSLPAAHALVLTEPSASYDVVFVFEALHDMAHPVPALRSMREALRPGGRVVVMDEATMDEFGVDAPPPERLFYAASVLHCLPVGMSQEGSAGTGALMRPTTLRAYAADAGFADVQVAPVEHDLMRFYVLTP